MKSCSKCKINKDLVLFYENRAECKDCTRAARKKYYKENKQKCLKSMKFYESRNKDSLAKYRSKYNKLNKEKRAKYEKKYYQDNKDKIIERDRILYNKKYTSDPVFKLKCVLRKRLNAALKNNYKSGSAVRDLGCSISDLKKHLESQFQKGMTWENHGKWHIDHIVPLASFNLSDPEELKKACHYSNLQPLWAFDNLSKGSTTY